MTDDLKSSIPPAYFEEKFKADIDPWRFRTSAYEHDKYRATLAALTMPLYRDVLEIGCAIGVFSSHLAPRCGRLLAVDGSETAIAEAAKQKLGNVQFERAVLPNDFPSERFDLIVLSEVLYYFSEIDLECLAEKCLGSFNPGTEMVLCHWLGETNYPLTGHQASDFFAQAVSKRRPTRVILHEGIYRLERLSF